MLLKTTSYDLRNNFAQAAISLQMEINPIKQLIFDHSFDWCHDANQLE